MGSKGYLSLSNDNRRMLEGPKDWRGKGNSFKDPSLVCLGIARPLPFVAGSVAN